MLRNGCRWTAATGSRRSREREESASGGGHVTASFNSDESNDCWVASAGGESLCLCMCVYVCVSNSDESRDCWVASAGGESLCVYVCVCV